jgi:hypothetical protein
MRIWLKLSSPAGVRVTRATSSWQALSVTKRRRLPPPVWPALVHTAWSAWAIHSRSEVTTSS